MAQAEVDIQQIAPAPSRRVQRSPLASLTWRRIIIEGLAYLFLIAAAIVMLLPLFWMIIGGFKSEWEVTAVPAVWLPSQWRWDNYWYVMTQGLIATGYMNSLFLVTIVTVVSVTTSIIGGYVFAKLRFPGRELLFIGVISTLMLPGFLIQIPMFVMMAKLEWLNTYQAMIVPFLLTPFGIFMMRQFMMGLPTEYIDSARIDGASEVSVIWRIVFPLVKEAAAALSIFVFIQHWNELFWPLLVLRQREMFTLPLALFALNGDYNTVFSLILAGATIAIIPVVIVYAVLQEHIIRGVTLTGLKG
ncbi:MAG: carbohydrate ABC transporter permease [Chloroflexota bacterium]